MNQDVAPLVYGQQQFLFYTPTEALKWLIRIGRCNWSYIHHVMLGEAHLPKDVEHTCLGRGKPGKEANPKTHSVTWEHVLRNMPNLKTLECGTTVSIIHRYDKRPEPHCHHVRAHSSPRIPNKIQSLRIGYFGLSGFSWCSSSISEKSLGQDLHELKHLSIRCNQSSQRTASRLPDNFFTQFSPLQSFDWRGQLFRKPIIENFIGRHGSTLRSLDL